MRTRFRLIMLACALLTGCGGGNTSNITPPPVQNSNISGSWHATVTSNVFQQTSTADMFIVQNGTSLTSNRVLLDSTCSTLSASMSGTINGNSVTLVINEGNSPPDTVTATGTLAGSTITGSYTTSGACTNGDQGTFSAQLIPSIQSSQWTGSTSSVNGTTTFTANITENNQGDLGGSITFSGSPCFTTLNVAGLIVGNQVALNDTQGLIQAFGTVASNGKSISGTYAVSGSCAENGTFVMNRP